MKKIRWNLAITVLLLAVTTIISFCFFHFGNKYTANITVLYTLALILIAPQLAKVVLAFGSWEYFAVCILGLAVVITMSCEDVVKGLIGALLGLLLGCVGIDAVSGVSRLDFGNWQLQGGIQSTALMMGLFAISEILHQCRDLSKEKKKSKLFV